MTQGCARRWVVVAWIAIVSVELALGCGRPIGGSRNAVPTALAGDIGDGGRSRRGTSDSLDDSASLALGTDGAAESPDAMSDCPRPNEPGCGKPIVISPSESPPRPPLILFAQGEAELDARSRGYLDTIARAVIIHATDTTELLEARGYAAPEERDPGRLSSARAQAVFDYLIGRGVGPAKLLPKGYGVRRGEGESRSVEIVVVRSRKK
jgi:outer membrane protein OmpA-like peptidoglycan-associated protein